LPNFLKQFSQIVEKVKNEEVDNKESKEFVYEMDLCYLIDQEIYTNHKSAQVHNWRLGALHKEWNDLLQSGCNLVIEAPRDHLKSFFFSECYPLEECLKDPDMSIIIMSASDGLAVKRLDNIKKWAKAPRYKHLLAGADIDSRKEIRFSNGATIEVAGFGSKVRGGHYKIIILDDPIDNQVIYSEDYNRKTLERMSTEIMPMGEPYTKFIIVGTLQRDGDMYSVDWNSIEIEGNKHWIHKRYDAIVDAEKKITIYPEKWSWNRLMAKKQEIITLTGSDKWFNKEYRCMPVNISGEIVKVNDIQGYDVLPNDCWKLMEDGTKKININDFWGWDISVGKKPDSGDYTSGIHFYRSEKGNIFIDNIVNKRLGFDDRLKEIMSGAELYPTAIRVAVEQNTFQYDSVQTLKMNTSLPIAGVQTTKNKIEKFNEVLPPLFGNRKVFIKNGIENRQEFINQLLSLPRGKYDDMADAFCIGISGLQQVGTPGVVWLFDDDDDDGEDLM